MKESFDGYIHIGSKTYDPAVYNKYLETMRIGRRAFSRGEYQEFKGYEPDAENALSMRAFLTKESNEQIDDRVVNPIRLLAKAYGINMYPSGEFWIRHVGIVDLRYRPNKDHTKDEIFQNIEGSGVVSDSLAALKGQAIMFDSLWPGNAVPLAASQLPLPILQVRQSMSELGLVYGMDMKDVANIIHTTIARFGPKSEVNVRAVNAFGRGILGIHHKLVKDPIYATIDHAQVMSNKQFEFAGERKLMQAVAGN